MIRRLFKIALPSLIMLSTIACDQTDHQDLRSENNSEDSDLPLGMSDSDTEVTNETDLSLGSSSIKRPSIVAPVKNQLYSINTLRSEWIVGSRGSSALPVHRIWLASILVRNGKVTTEKLLMDELTDTNGMNNIARIQANLPTVGFNKKYRFAVATCDNHDANGSAASCINPQWTMSDFTIKTIQPAPAAPQLTVTAGTSPSSPVTVVYKSSDASSHERTTHFEEYAALKRNGAVVMVYTSRQSMPTYGFHKRKEILANRLKITPLPDHSRAILIKGKATASLFRFALAPMASLVTLLPTQRLAPVQAGLQKL
jgi:hypothetical protein